LTSTISQLCAFNLPDLPIKCALKSQMVGASVGEDDCEWPRRVLYASNALNAY
jgi:hypothetical protein